MRTRPLPLLSLPILATVFLTTACTTSDYDDQPIPQERPRASAQVRAMTPGALEMMLPENWWHDALATPLNLTGEQLASLDAIAREQQDEITRLDHDISVPQRELRERLDADKPSADDIIAAGTRLRALRDALFDHQLKMLAAERAVLSVDQWHKLQDALRAQRAERRENRGNYGGPRGGGRGGRGGGRRPGWPG